MWYDSQTALIQVLRKDGLNSLSFCLYFMQFISKCVIYILHIAAERLKQQSDQKPRGVKERTTNMKDIKLKDFTLSVSPLSPFSLICCSSRR